MLGDILKALSLSKQESDIFMQLARLDSAPASRIAQKTRLKRTTCYQLLEDVSHLHDQVRQFEMMICCS